MPERTVLIPIFDGTISKNLLRTPILTLLKETPGVRIVLIPPAGKIDWYQKEFASATVLVETTPVWRHSRWEFLFEQIFKHSIPTQFMRLRQVDWYWNEGKYVRYAGASLLRFLGRFASWRRLLRVFSELEPISPHVRAIYDRWKPDLVFAPTMIPRDEVAFMRLARKDGKQVVGMPKSFDNLTSKAFLRVFPDWLLVPNPNGAEEAVRLYGYPREQCVVVGIPQYDMYARPPAAVPHDAFLASLGLDARKRTILYAPAGDWMNPTDKDTLALVLGWIASGELPNAQVLLRLHPGYTSATEELSGVPHLAVERPGQRHASLKDYEFLESDIRHLMDELRHADVVENTASTMTVEAAMFDRPVVLIGFDAHQQKSYWQSVLRYYDREHYIPIVRSGGAPLAKSPEELLRLLNAYLDQPSLDAKGRARIVEDICYRMDGKASERIVSVLRRCLASAQPQ